MRLTDRVFSGHATEIEPVDAYGPVGVLDEHQIGKLVLACTVGEHVVNEEDAIVVDAYLRSMAAKAQARGIDEVVVGGGFAWATNGKTGTVFKVDSRGHIVATFRTGRGAHEPSFSAGKLWVSNEAIGTLTSIDAAVTRSERKLR
jgi:hypothetical protein